VNPFGKKEILQDPRLSNKEYTKVPIALFHGEEQVNDSLEIVKRLCEKYHWKLSRQKEEKASLGEEASSSSSSSSPDLRRENERGGVLTPEEERDIKWVYENLVPLFPACMYQSFASSWRAFSYISSLSNFTPIERLLVRTAGPIVMRAVTRLNEKKRMKTGSPVQALSDACDEWMRRIREQNTKQHKTKKEEERKEEEVKKEIVLFHGGAAPDLADSVTLGFLRAMKESPSLREVRRVCDPSFNLWLTEMEKRVLP
ncbi:glutathione s- n-terminal domain-containing protein, partial [Cystoisospora suis]